MRVKLPSNMLTRDQLIDLIDKHDLTEHKDFILQHSKPAIHITREYVPDENDLPIGTSKIGGNPDLPADFMWQYYKGNPLTFLAQIKLSDVKPYDVDDVLPDSGWLYFFYEIDKSPWGEANQKDGWQVVYIEDESIPLHRINHPTSQGEYFRIQALSSFKLSYSELWTVSIADEIWMTLATSTPMHEDPTASKYQEIVDAIEQYAPLHYMLGNAFDLQRDSRKVSQFGANGYIYGTQDYDKNREILEAGIKDWILLFQMESDRDWKHHFNLMFGRSGSVYFMIRKQDLAAKNFANTWLVQQNQ